MHYKKKYGVIAFFIAALVFFWYQHSCALYWDFLAYILNARHLLGGNYFEWMRPPLVSLMMVPFTIFGTLGEYMYIGCTLAFFTYSAIQLAKALRVREDLFLLFLIQPLFLIYGAREGSELLAGGLFALFLSYLLKDKALSGVFLGLGMIARYNMIYFIPALLFLKRRKWFLGFLFASLPMACWLMVNLILTGNLFTSLADNIALNKIFRMSSQPFPWTRLFFLLWAPLALAVFGVLKKLKKWNKKDWIIASTVPIIFYVFLSIPLKVDRYLIFLIFPLAYFICKAWSTRPKIFIATSLLIISSMLWFSSQAPVCGDINGNEIRDAGDGLTGQVFSDGWIHLNYIGVDAFPKPSNEAMHYFLLSGRKAAILKKYFHDTEPSPEDGYPILRNDEDILVLGIDGIQGAPLAGDSSYLELRSLDRRIADNEAFDPNPCYYVIRNPVFIEPCLWFHGEASRKDYSNEVISQGDHPFAREYLQTEKKFCEQGLPVVPKYGIARAVALEKVAALGCGMDREAFLKEATGIWFDAGFQQRAMLVKNLSNDVRPFPLFNSTYYADYEPGRNYCDLEPCDIPVLAFQAEGVWYFPGGEGSYKYRIRNASVYDERNFFLSEVLVQVTDLEEVVIP